MSRRLLDVGPLALVLWALSTPWAWGFSTSVPAVANHIAFGMAFAPLALLAPALRPAAATCAAGGAWLAASPFLLGYSGLSAAAWAVDLTAGALLALIAHRLARRPASG